MRMVIRGSDGSTQREIPKNAIFQVIREHDDILDKHNTELKVQAEQIKQLQDNSMKLENIVMSENRETRATITETNKQLMELMNGMMGYNTNKHQANQSLNIARWESIVKIIGILAGSGGILYYVFA